MPRLRVAGLPSYNRTKGTASTTPSGKNSKGAAASSSGETKKGKAASTSSGPAKNAKTAASSSKGEGKQDESQLKFQALQDSMPPPTKPAGTNAASMQGGKNPSSTQPKPDDLNKANAPTGFKPPEKKPNAKAEGGATAKGSKSGEWTTKKTVVTAAAVVGGIWLLNKMGNGEAPISVEVN